jgi:hypothetical protein
MNVAKATLLLALGIGMGGTAAAQTPVPGAAPPAGPMRPPGGFVEPTNPPPVKSQPAGPYAVTVEADPAFKTHTIYRPTDLAPFTGKKRLPIVAWGNGGCMNIGRAAEVFLTHIASYGYIAIAGGPIDAPRPNFGAAGRPPGAAPGAAPAGVPAAAQPGPPPGMPPGGQTKDESLAQAIDWAIAQNTRAGSPLNGKIDTAAVAVMGTSCGGLQALANSPDPRVKTTIAWNSGTFPPEANRASGMSAANRATLQQLHAPIAYITGGPVDIAQPNAEADFALIDKVPVFFGWIDVGHGGTFRQPEGGRYGEVAVNWLDWQLKGDKTAAKMFAGADCTLCRDPIWTVKKKNLQ